MLRLLLVFSALAFVAYMAAIGGLYSVQRRLLYPLQTFQATAAEAGLAGFEDVVLTTADGERLVGWWKPPQPGRALVVFFHGNGSSLYGDRGRVAALAAGGRGVLFVAYRGYSGSSGAPTEEGLRIDARTAYAFAAAQCEPSRIVLYGESLGSAVAVRLAAERPVAGVILDAPFTSAVDVAAIRYWFAPVAYLMKDPFRSVDVIAQIKAPLLILHGEEDRTVPFRLGEALFSAAAEPKRFVRLPGIGHGDVLERGGLAEAQAFLAWIEAGRSGPYAGSPAAPEP